MDNRTSANLYVVLCHLHRVWGIGNCSLIYDADHDDDGGGVVVVVVVEVLKVTISVYHTNITGNASLVWLFSANG